MAESEEFTFSVRWSLPIVGVTLTGSVIRRAADCEHYFICDKEYSAEMFIPLMREHGFNYELRDGHMVWGDPPILDGFQEVKR